VPDYLFLACFGDNVQAATAAEWAYHDRGARSVAVLANASITYTSLLRDYFVARFTELGGRVVSRASYRPGGLDAAVGRLKQADFVFAAVAPDEVVDAIRRLRAAGFHGPVLGGDGYDLGEVWLENPDIGGVYFTTHAYLGADSANARVQAFRAAYRAAYPGDSPDAFSALGYDAARLLIDAIRRAGSDDPAKLREALGATRDLTRDFEGVTGRVSFVGGSRIPSKTVSILEVEGGKLGLVRQLAPEKPPAP